ncbi:SAM-dependent methyltransferase [Streptomyces sp. MS19]|uniref:SAM-dependent methyltransferase n=1 Tax=Streptomyces sp. MS19 TaxID=3385972 RepID=UPI00399FB7C7
MPGTIRTTRPSLPGRAAAAQALRDPPHARTVAHADRAFMHRLTRVLAAGHGSRQWLDIGTGIPTPPNLHEVARSVAPGARVVYVDDDRVVALAHTAALLGRAPETVLPGDPAVVVGPPTAALPSGSAPALTHATRGVAAVHRGAGNPPHLRTHGHAGARGTS